MAITNFIPEVWAAQLLVSLKKSLVYGQAGVVNRDYEGEISQYGDTVHITNIVQPTIGDYTAHTDITVEELDDDTRALVIDQSKYFAFEVDDIEKRQARSDVQAEGASESAYGLRDVADQYIAGLMNTDVDAGNQLGELTLADTQVYDEMLIPMSVRLDEENVPAEGRWLVVSPAVHGELLKDDRFVRADASGSTAGLRNAFIGRAAGFDILKSNNTPAGAATGRVQIAGYPGAFSYAEQINNVEAFRVEKRFADALKGLHLYGAKTVRPTGLVTADVTVGGGS